VSIKINKSWEITYKSASLINKKRRNLGEEWYDPQSMESKPLILGENVRLPTTVDADSN